MPDQVARAARVAAHAHRNQFRKYPDPTGILEPYIVHPSRVAGRVMADQATFAHGPYATLDDLVSAAWLHDVVEDTPLELYYLSEMFSPVVVDIVRGLTRQYAHAQDRFNPAISLPHPPSAGSRAERKKIELRYLSGQSPSAKLIKAYDRMDNLRDILHAGRDFARLYARETIDLVEVLAPHIPFDLSLHLKEKSEKILHLVDQPAQCPTVDVEAMRIVYDHRED